MFKWYILNISPFVQRHHMVSGTLAPFYTVFWLKLGCNGAASEAWLAALKPSWLALKPAWLAPRPDWLAPRPAWPALGPSRGGKDRRMDRRTDGRTDGQTK